MRRFFRGAKCKYVVIPNALTETNQIWIVSSIRSDAENFGSVYVSWFARKLTDGQTDRVITEASFSEEKRAKYSIHNRTTHKHPKYEILARLPYYRKYH